MMFKLFKRNPLKPWQKAAFKQIDKAAARAKRGVLETPDNGYHYVYGEIDVNLVRRHDDGTLTVKLYTPL